MKVSDLLKKLGISLNLLRLVGEKANVKISNEDQRLIPYKMQRIERIVKRDDFPDLIEEIKSTYNNTVQEAYSDEKEHCFIGQIKWFSDADGIKNYGFAEIKNFGDIYFKRKNVYKSNANDLVADSFVIIRISNKQIALRKKKSASQVNFWDDEENVTLLVHLKVYDQIPRYKEKEFDRLITEKLLNLDKNQLRLLSLYIDNIPPEKFKFDQLDFYRSLYKMCHKSFAGSTLIQNLHQNQKFELWQKDPDLIPIESIKDRLVKSLLNKEDSNPEALFKESAENQQEIFEFTLKLIVTSKEDDEGDKLSKFSTLFKKANSLELDLPINTVPDDIIHELWRKKLVDNAMVSEIYKEYFTVFQESIRQEKTEIAESIKSKFPEDFHRLSQAEISDLLIAHFYDLDNIDQKDYNFFEVLLEFEISKDQNKKLIGAIQKKADGYGKLRLFIDDYVQTVDFDDAVLYTALLNNEDQKLFFKKCISLVEKDQADWQISDFKRILSVDYDLYAKAKGIGNYNLDFSLSMILHIVDQIANGEKINQQSIFKIVTDVIKDPKELLEITGFFDKCHGRQSLKEIPKTEPQEYELENYKDSNPRFATYCEGRKAIKDNGEPATWKDTGKEFHWCENAPCFFIARQQKTTEDWEKYSLRDVLRILKIPFSENQYEQLIGTINKANRFFEHLYCRKCNHILHPSRKDNYGFYRVSNFVCKNPDCNENNNIYLSHCANGQCLDIVDSRDTVRCKTEGNDDNCGWYVCNNCHSCCKTKNIKHRAFILESNGQEYNCHKEGHWDRQKICCNECGTEMNEFNSNYDKVLQWFLENKKTHPNIIKYGKNKFDKYWFLWRQGNLSNERYRETLVNLKRSGFNIPSFEDLNKNSQLIAEPRYRPNPADRTFKCPECDNELLFQKSEIPRDQYVAIKKYHFERGKDPVHN